jgi:hypothetical protein
MFFFRLTRKQGDLIGRIFDYWAIVYFGKLFVIYRVNKKNWATFFSDKNFALVLTKNGLGYILGPFLQTHLVTLHGKTQKQNNDSKSPVVICNWL